MFLVMSQLPVAFWRKDVWSLYFRRLTNLTSNCVYNIRPLCVVLKEILTASATDGIYSSNMLVIVLHVLAKNGNADSYQLIQNMSSLKFLLQMINMFVSLSGSNTKMRCVRFTKHYKKYREKNWQVVVVFSSCANNRCIIGSLKTDTLCRTKWSAKSQCDIYFSAHVVESPLASNNERHSKFREQQDE